MRHRPPSNSPIFSIAYSAEPQKKIEKHVNIVYVLRDANEPRKIVRRRECEWIQIALLTDKLPLNNKTNKKTEKT